MTNKPRTPRNLEEAFGPYERGNVQDEIPRTTKAEKVVLLFIGIVALAWLAFVTIVTLAGFPYG